MNTRKVTLIDDTEIEALIPQTGIERYLLQNELERRVGKWNDGLAEQNLRIEVGSWDDDDGFRGVITNRDFSWKTYANGPWIEFFFAANERGDGLYLWWHIPQMDQANNDMRPVFADDFDPNDYPLFEAH